MILVKMHEARDSILLGIADKSVLGKTYEDKNGFLNLKEYADFYQGDAMTEDKLTQLLSIIENQPSYSINAVGAKSVAIIKKKFKCSEKKVKGIPHVQIYKM